MRDKMIIVPHNGPIYAKSGVYGPISTPYREDVNTIFRMISSSVKVVEILNDGTQLPLDTKNFDKDNNPVVEVKVEAPVTPGTQTSTPENTTTTPDSGSTQAPAQTTTKSETATPPATNTTTTANKNQQYQRNVGKNRPVVPDATEDK